MDNFDKILEDQIKNDKLTQKPSETTFNQLHNQMLAKSGASKLKQNSFIPILKLGIANENLAWKISIAAILLISFMGLKQMNSHSIYMQMADSTRVHQTVDTLNFQLADSSFFY